MTTPRTAVGTRVSELHAQLIKDGYVEIPEYKGIKAGVRVHHSGQRYVEAYRNGTAEVRHVFRNEGSYWEQVYKRPDIEVIVVRDAPLLPDMSPVSQWANYHTCLTVDGLS